MSARLARQIAAQQQNNPTVKRHATRRNRITDGKFKPRRLRRSRTAGCDRRDQCHGGQCRDSPHQSLCAPSLIQLKIAVQTGPFAGYVVMPDGVNVALHGAK